MKNRSLKIIIYTIVIFCFLFLTNNKIAGPFCARHICAILLFVYSLINYRDRTIDKIEKHYLTFVGVYTIVSVLNGEIFHSYFFPNFFSYYFSAIVLIIGIPILVRTKVDYKCFLIAFGITYVLNCGLTICQFLNYSWAWEIGQMANGGLSREMESNAFLFDGTVSSFMGRTITAGFTGFVVTNGYFTASCIPAALSSCINERKKSILLFAIVILGALTCFVNQQRSAFAFFGLFVVCYLLYFYRSRFKYLTFTVAILLAIFYGSMIFTFDFGRLLEFSDSTRAGSYNDFFVYAFSTDAILGGYTQYLSNYGLMQHNSIFSALTISGYIGFFVFISLYVRVLWYLLKRVRKTDFADSNSVQTSLLAVGCLLYQLYSLTHSSGLQNDGMMFFVMYTLIIANDSIKKRELATIR